MAVEKENVRRDLQAREHEMEKDSFSHPEQCEVSQISEEQEVREN
jgi:hypothetical protein